MISKNAVLSVLIVMLFSSFVFCQNPLKKGVYKLGGSVQFTTGSYDEGFYETNDMYFNLSPSFSYFVTDNLLIGTSFNFSYNEQSYTPRGEKEQRYINRDLGFSPEITYYFPAEKFIPFIGAGVNYSKSLGRDGFSYGFSGKAGINYFISSNAALEPFLDYTILKKSDVGYSRKFFTIGLGVSYFITD